MPFAARIFQKWIHSLIGFKSIAMLSGNGHANIVGKTGVAV